MSLNILRLKEAKNNDDNFDSKKILPEESEDKDISPLVKQLIGIAKLPENFDVRKEYTEYLMKKYK